MTRKKSQVTRVFSSVSSPVVSTERYNLLMIIKKWPDKIEREVGHFFAGLQRTITPKTSRISHLNEVVIRSSMSNTSFMAPTAAKDD